MKQVLYFSGILLLLIHQAVLAEKPDWVKQRPQLKDYYIGIGITTLVHTIDPGSVVLGGAMNFGGHESPIGQRFLTGISSEFQKRTFDYVFAGTTIRFATLGGDAGYLGAAGYARKAGQH